MLRRLSLPLALISLAVVATVALLVIFLPAQDAGAPEEAPRAGESETQADAQAQAAALTEAETQAPAATAQGVAAGFEDRLVTGAIGATALAFTPDDRLLVTDRTGRVRVSKPGSTNTTVALDISGKVCSNSERGALGIAVDPNFGTNHFVYLYYTYKKFGVCPEHQPEQNNNPVNRVSRFVMNGDTLSPASEEVLINNIPSPNGNHNAGDLHFGKDDKLYVSVGDGSCDYAEPTKCQPENDASRDKHVLLGKILRINTDGTIPADNPYAGNSNGVRCGILTNNNARGGSAAAPGTVCKETFAMGFRNPFRFAVDPDATGTSVRVNDVGGARIEEVDQVRSGGDYGWNCREGTLVLNTQAPCPAPNMVGPIHQYGHTTGCSSITGGAFVPNGAGWPSYYDDAYLFGDYVCKRIFRMKPLSGGGFERTTFATDLAIGGPVSLAFGPEGSPYDGSLYYTTYAGGGQVRRISYVVGNKAPTASVKVTNENYGEQTKEFQFSGQDSTDFESGPLTYAWDFDYANDTFEPDPNATGATASHTYGTQGTYTVALRVTDDEGASDISTVQVYPGDTAPPRPVIGSPAAGKLFRVGEGIALSGSATDADEPNNAPSLQWEVIRHHTAPNTHTHPLKQGTGSTLPFTAPGPEDLRSMNPAGNYLEIRLTATDSQGLSTTVTRNLKPKTTYVRFATRPTAFYLVLNGTKFRAPRTFLSWEGYKLNVSAPPQRRDGRWYVFRAWSDGRGNPHTIVTPENNTTYVATFRLNRR